MFQEIGIIKPRLIVTLGNVPLKAILKERRKNTGDLHGAPIKQGDYYVFPLYHPASIIYNPTLKTAYIDDWFEEVKGIYWKDVLVVVGWSVKITS